MASNPDSLNTPFLQRRDTPNIDTKLKGLDLNYLRDSYNFGIAIFFASWIGSYMWLLLEMILNLKY